LIKRPGRPESRANADDAVGGVRHHRERGCPGLFHVRDRQLDRHAQRREHVPRSRGIEHDRLGRLSGLVILGFLLREPLGERRDGVLRHVGGEDGPLGNPQLGGDSGHVSAEQFLRLAPDQRYVVPLKPLLQHGGQFPETPGVTDAARRHQPLLPLSSWKPALAGKPGSR